MRKFILAFTFFALLPAMAWAGVSVGERIPHTLTLKDHNGERQSFDTLKGEKGAVLVFVRSVDWCPFCQAQLIQLGLQAENIEALGYNVLPISYDAPEKQAAFVNRYGFAFTILSDVGSEAIKAFGILNEDMKPDSPYHGVPHPAIYVVSADGKIQSILQEEGYKERPDPADIVAAIQNLRN